MAKKAQASPKNVDAFKHDEATRKNIPTAEYEALVQEREKTPIRVAYERRNRDLDPQLVWRGKDAQDESDLIVSVAPLYIQEKVHPKALIDDLLRETREREHAAGQIMPDLFSDFNGIPKGVDKTEFYQHDQNWSNRMILGDSLQVMASLAEREGLRGKVQCIYIDPPYGIKFNSNFQWSTTDKSGTTSDSGAKITREPEQVRAFRDTWRDGIHSYLTYLRNRLLAAHELLSESGSVFLQISDENVHRVRALLDESFGVENFIAIIPFRKKTMPFGAAFLEQMDDFILWYAKDKTRAKYRPLFVDKDVRGDQDWVWFLDAKGDAHRMSEEQAALHVGLPPQARIYRLKSLEPSGEMLKGKFRPFFQGKQYDTPKNGYGTTPQGMKVLESLGRLQPKGRFLNYRLFLEDYPISALTVPWQDTVGADDKNYVVQTNTHVVKRCILMTSDPGDLVLDPTCGSGTTAVVAEQWGRRWIVIDTSRVALALSRARIMGARFPFYYLADSRDGQIKQGETLGQVPSTAHSRGDIRQGFVYNRAAHITLNSVANNPAIDVVWEKWAPEMAALQNQVNESLGKSWEEWQIPTEPMASWSQEATKAHSAWTRAKKARQAELDACVVARTDFELLFDKPVSNDKTVRVAGPFTVESLDPHRTLGVDENDELIDPLDKKPGNQDADQSFVAAILESLKIAGVQQAHKEDKIVFTSLTPWQGDRICADGRYIEGAGADEKLCRAAVFVGPEFGTVTRPDLVEAAREAAESGFDVLVACAFSYEAYATEFEHLGSLRVLKARMNADLHMAADLKNTGKGNLFVIFGEPDIDVDSAEDDKLRVKINGVDVFDPTTGEVRSDGPDGIACWFIDTDYNAESFFVRHAYFLGANDPYGSLKTTLKAEIDEEAWESLHSDVSRPFPKPKSGRIAVKVINHLGDEVMKVFKVAS